MSVQPRLFFLATDNNQPAGGRRIIYHLVDILVQNGFNAYVLHQKRNFRYTWFKNETPVAYSHQIMIDRAKNSRSNYLSWCIRLLKTICSGYFGSIKSKSSKVKINGDDLLVVPATRTAFIDEVLPGVKKVTLSQNHFLFFNSYFGDGANNKYLHPDIIARIAMSKTNYELQRYSFPDVRIDYVPIYIDSQLFNFTKRKKRQIAYMPRKSGEDSRCVINCLKYRNQLKDFSIIPIENMSQEEVATVLKESLIFLSFSHREGFGLPPAEAMACGCIVIGYSGNGGDEFFQRDVCFEIKEGDVSSYTKTIERVIDKYLKNPEPLDKLRRNASDTILGQYSFQKTQNALLEVFDEMVLPQFL